MPEITDKKESAFITKIEIISNKNACKLEEDKINFDLDLNENPTRKIGVNILGLANFLGCHNNKEFPTAVVSSCEIINILKAQAPNVFITTNYNDVEGLTQVGRFAGLEVYKTDIPTNSVFVGYLSNKMDPGEFETNDFIAWSSFKVKL